VGVDDASFNSFCQSKLWVYSGNSSNIDHICESAFTVPTSDAVGSRSYSRAQRAAQLFGGEDFARCVLTDLLPASGGVGLINLTPYDGMCEAALHKLCDNAVSLSISEEAGHVQHSERCFAKQMLVQWKGGVRNSHLKHLEPFSANIPEAVRVWALGTTSVDDEHNATMPTAQR
jgi:hypothetical protein